MAYNHAAQKARSRRIVHTTMAVSGLYAFGVDAPRAVTVRWHNKITVHGDLQHEGYAQILEGVDRLIFNIEELAAPSDGGAALQLQRGGIITLPDYQNAAFELDTEQPVDGPIEQIWSVARQ